MEDLLNPALVLFCCCIVAIGLVYLYSWLFHPKCKKCKIRMKETYPIRAMADTQAAYVCPKCNIHEVRERVL